MRGLDVRSLGLWITIEMCDSVFRGEEFIRLSFGSYRTIGFWLWW